MARAISKTAKIARIDALQGAMASHSWVAITAAAHASRLSLRAPRASLGALSQALDLELPTKPKTSVASGKRAALWLGPDEWLLIGPVTDDLATPLAQVSAFHSAVDISHRNVGILVAGKGAQIVANPHDPVPMPMIGHVTSSYWSQNCGRSIALGLVAGGRDRLGQTLYVPMPDGVVEVEVTGTVFFDEEGERLNG